MNRETVSKPPKFIAALFAVAFFFSTELVYSQVNSVGASQLTNAGKTLFQTYCVCCHGPAADGKGPVASTLRQRPADLTTIAKRRGGEVSWGEIAKFIDGRTKITAHGERTMPVWGKRFNDDVANEGLREEITRGDLAALISYLKSIQQ